MALTALWGRLDSIYSNVNDVLLDQATFMPTSLMIAPLSIGNHQQNPYIEAKIHHIHSNGMVFGEWIAPSSKLEEVIVNPVEGEERVIKSLNVGMTVHVRYPRRNTKPGAQTLWRCFLRPLSEQPIYLQEACLQKSCSPIVEAEIEPPSIEQAEKPAAIGAKPRVTITEGILVDYMNEWASAGNYTGNNAASKAVMDIIRAAMRAGLKPE